MINLMALDGSIVVMAMVAYKNIGAGIYALLAIAVSAMVTDKLNSGFNKADMFYIFIITTLIISKKPGNTGISRDIRTEFTTDLLLSD